MEEFNIDSAGEAKVSKHGARGANSGGASDEVAALITAGAADPASPAAVALADAWRRAGRADVGDDFDSSARRRYGDDPF